MINFNKEGFKNYMIEEFPSVFTNHFTWNWLDGTIDYCLKTSYSTNDFIAALTGILPEVTKDEVLDYVEGVAICRGCGRRYNFEEAGVWVTSSYPLCNACYDLLREELEKIRKENE